MEEMKAERTREGARALQSSGSSAAALILHYGPGATKIYSKTKMLERKKKKRQLHNSSSQVVTQL